MPNISSFLRSSAAAGLVVALAACGSTQQSDSGLSGSGRTGDRATPAASRDVGAVPLSSAEQQRVFSTEVGDRVWFDTDAHTLKPAGVATLDKQVAWLKQNPRWNIVIEGHADERGTREYNLALAERRATTVRAYLVNQGVPAGRISTISYGKERLAVTGGDEAAWAQNRRAVTILAN